MNAPVRGTMGLADIIATTFTLFIRNARTFLVLGLLGAVLTVAVVAVVQVLADRIGLKFDTSNGAGQFERGSAVGLLALVALQILTTTLVYLLGDALVVPAAFEALVGKRPSIASALVSFRYSLATILMAWLIIGVSVTAMLISVILIPLAVFLLIRWSFIVQIINREGLSALRARARSSDIVRGFWWRVFLIQIAVAVLAALPGLVLRPVGSVFNNMAADYLMAGLAALLSGPFAAIARTVLYADIKLRRGEQLRPTTMIAG